MKYHKSSDVGTSWRYKVKIKAIKMALKYICLTSPLGGEMLN